MNPERNPAVGTTMKRVLFVTYYFPPSGGPGVQRSLKFVKYLSNFGWRATVLTVNPEFAAYPNLDPGLSDEIPAEVSVLRTKARDPYAVYARMMGVQKDNAVGVGFLNRHKTGFREHVARWIRANLFIPDARIGWVGYARREARREVDRKQYDAIFSTGPPHSAHLIARELHRITGLPWILDLRDAWPPDSFAHLLPMSGFARSIDARKRIGSFDNADLLVAVSDSLCRDAAAQTTTPVEIIPNGFDQEDFAFVEPIQNDAFTIVYVGNISAEQNPTALWHAIKQRKMAGAWPEMRVRFVGNVANEVLAAIEQAGLRRYVDFLPYVEHHEALRHMCGAEILLLSINRVPNPTGIVTGKLYEYLASGRPILCFSPTDGDATGIIDASGAGESFRYEHAEGVAAMLDRHYEAWKRGHPIQGCDAERSAPYSRELQTKRLADLLNTLTEES